MTTKKKSMETEVQAALKARRPGDDARDSLPQWPAGKAFPRFKSEKEEQAFYAKWDFAEHYEASSTSDRVVYEPRSTTKGRTLVYRVRLNEREMATLQRVANDRGVTVSAVIRDVVHSMDAQ